MYVAPSFTFSVNSPGSQQKASYFDFSVNGSENSAYAAGTLLDAWCMDISIGINPGQSYTGYIYSSYETGILNSAMPTYAAYTGNLDNINWLLNYYDGSDTQYNWGEVQSAIWTLMGQDYSSQLGYTESNGAVVLASDVDSLVTQALSHDGYVPGEDDSVAVIIDSVDANGQHGQPIFCEVKAASLGDRVWEDKNANGLQDTGERGIAGAKVELVRDLDGNGQISSNEVLATTTTNADGNYRFDGLTPGLQYQVQFTQPAGYRANSPRQADGSTGSNNNSDGLLSDVVVLSPGEHNSTLDAGFVPKPCAKLIGAESINEGYSGSYYVQLDQALDHDVTFTLQTVDQTAQRVDQYAYGQQIMWGGYYTDASGKHYVNPNGGYIPLGQTAGQGWVKAFGPNGNDSWDYTLYSGSAIQSGGTTTVTIKAGQTTSDSVTAYAWKETIHVDGDAGNSAGYLEGTEQFSMSITGSSDNCIDICKPTVTTDICDTTSYHYFSPIALDLDGNGIQTTAIGQTTGKFDLLGDGTDVTSGWLSSGDAFLAVDASGNGAIDSVKELFGGNKGDGFAKLASFDTNGDGVVNAADARFGELLVWQDANSNHQSDAGELRTLAQAGISSLNVAYVDQEFTDAAGNVHGETGVATRADGSSIDMVDVYFNYAETSAMGTNALPASSELLGGDGLDSLLGPDVASEPTVMVCYSGSGLESYPMVAEMLRQLGAGEAVAAS